MIVVGCAFFDELSADNEFCTFSVGFCEIIWLVVGDAVGFMLVGGCETGTRVGVGNEDAMIFEDVGNKDVGNKDVGNDVFVVGRDVGAELGGNTIILNIDTVGKSVGLL